MPRLTEIFEEFVTGQITDQSSIAINHNKGDYPETVIVRDANFNIVSPSSYVVTNPTANQTVITFPGGPFYGKYEFIFRELRMFYKGVLWKIVFESGKIDVVDITSLVPA